MLSSQSNDGDATTDTRLFLVPSADHPHGSKRPVFGWTGGNYPRYVGEDRGKMNYVRKDGQKLSEPIGYIDEVEHTYAYYDGTFGLLNEHGVGIAESTCTAKVLGAKPRPLGAALWYTDEMSRVALERCDNAKCAVKLMGKLAVEGGVLRRRQRRGHCGIIDSQRQG